MELGTLAALEQRITVRRTMTGMTSQETARYVHHHVQLPAAPTLFTDDAISLIHQSSRVNPAPSTGSRSPRSSPPAPPTKTSSTKPAPDPRSPKQPRTPTHDTLTTPATA